MLSQEKVFIKDSNYYDGLKEHPIYKYTIRVKDVYKGSLTNDLVVVYSEIDEASCGFLFEDHKTYIIYPSTRKHILKMVKQQLSNEAHANGMLWVSLCSRTKHVNHSEVRKLKKLRRITNT